MLKIIDIAPKIYGVFPLLAVGVFAILFFQKSPIDRGRVIILCASILLLCLLGLVAHIYSSQPLQEQIIQQISEIKLLRQERDSLMVESQRLLSLKDSCTFEKLKLRNTIESVKAENAKLKEEKINLSNHLKIKSDELKKQKAYKYTYNEGFTVVRDEDGMFGYLRENYPLSTVEYIYKSACKFSNGLAGVKYKSNKWGYVDKSLGVPIIKCQFEKAEAFEKNRAKVMYQGNWIWIDRQGFKISNVQ